MRRLGGANPPIIARLSLYFSARLHTAALVPVFAYGAGAQEYVGVYDNTALYDKIKRVKTR